MNEESLFTTARDMPDVAERRAFLDEACGGDDHLRRRVERLLVAAAHPPGILDQTVHAPPSLEAFQPGPLLAAAQVFARRFVLRQKLGEGGMGEVWAADQKEPVWRRVALKVIRPGLASARALSRFDQERQALALMNHPNIAKVHDAGVESGRPFFVMELIDGVPITRYCDEAKLTLRERLQLFLPVCEAVQHAHQKGVIHRDLKPSNILVESHDGKPVPKVIDFGLAKPTDPLPSGHNVSTEVGTLVGTPEHMSPEQADVNNVDVDTRADVYALGVLLYELLTGSVPHSRRDLQSFAFAEMLRIIREVDPPIPSKRLASDSETLPDVAACRQTEPNRLLALVVGELDWIVMKCLEKDPARRYETANELAADVKRYLADEPVLACPPSAGYRLRKFAQRNKVAVAVTGLVLFFLVFVGSGIGWTVRDRAARQTKVAGQVASILNEVDRLEREQKWAEALVAARRAEVAVAGGEADPATAQRVRAVLKDLEFIDRLEQIRMQRATWVAGTGLQTFDHAAAHREYRRAFRDHGVDVEGLPVEASIDRLGARPALAIPLAAALDEWVFARREVSRSDPAAAGWERLVAVARGIDPEPLRDRLRATWGQPVSKQLQGELCRLAESIDVRVQHPATVVSLAHSLRRVGQSGRALGLLRDAQYVYPGDFWLTFELGSALYVQKDLEGAVRYYTAAVSIRPTSAAAHTNLGRALHSQKRLPEVIAAFGKAIELNPKKASHHVNLGHALGSCGKLDEAIAAYDEAFRLQPADANVHHAFGCFLRDFQRDYEGAVGRLNKAIELDPKNAQIHLDLAGALRRHGKPDEAIAAYKEAIRLQPEHAPAHHALGCFLRDAKGDYEGAIACFEKAIELAPKNAETHFALGVALQKQGKLNEAAAAFREHERLTLSPAREALRLKPGDVAARDALARYSNRLAWHLATYPEPAFRDPDRAVSLAREAVELKAQDGNLCNTLGTALYRAGRWKDAIETLERADQLQGGKHLSFNAFFLAMAHWQLGGKEEARRWYHRAVEWMDKHQPMDEELRRFRAEASALLKVEEKK